MTLGEFLALIGPWVGLGGGAGMGFVIIKWLLETVFSRWDKKEAAIEAGTRELIDNLREQVAALQERERDREKRLAEIEEELRECKRRSSEWEAEVMRLKAMQQGYGDARQAVQLKIAADRGASE